MSNETQKTPKPKQVEVVLAKKHEHAGKQYKAGDKIQVTEPERDWLKKHGIVK